MTPEEQARELARAEQGMATLADTFPPFWRRMFLKCVEEGFSEGQALAIIQTWILKDAGHGVNGTRE